MKETCENCPDFADCAGICDDIKPQLEELPKRLPEIPESQLNEKQRDVEKDSGDTSGIDRYRQINPARVYEDAVDTEIDWEETSPQPVASEIEEFERRLLIEEIRMATRDDGLRFKRRLWAFLRCENIKKIAERSGTSKQNIQKQFQRTIGRVRRILSKGKPSDKRFITPLQFKKKANFASP
jgi:hypothetical protein